MSDTNVIQENQWVWRRLEEPIRLFGSEISGNQLSVFWLGVLFTILAIGFGYIARMYLRDSRTIGWAWASFLGILRASVYCMLAVLFLLPGWQSFDVVKSRSKVVFLFDVSGSMETRDEPTGSQPIEKIPTRQDKVLQLLKDEKVALLRRTWENNPVYVYRFGRFLDENYLVLEDGNSTVLQDGQRVTPAAWVDSQRIAAGHGGDEQLSDLWTSFLKPDWRSTRPAGQEEARKNQERLRRLCPGTNLGDSLLAALNRESNNLVQGIVVFTDGRSNEGSTQAYKELTDRARKAHIPLFMVRIGEDRPPVKIDIVDLRVPRSARPDDSFKVSVALTGEGLADQDVTINLDVYKPGTTPGKDKPFTTLSKVEKFKPTATLPNAQTEFEIAPAAFGEEDTGGQKLAVGEWKFVARVAKDKLETFAQAEHVTEPPAVVNVVPRPLRVLVFASAATREFQFVNNILLREVDKDRVDLSIYMQRPPGAVNRREGIVLGVKPEQMLTVFPTEFDSKIENPEGQEKIYNLANFDLIIGFDPDWTELSASQVEKLKSWVDNGGGLIIVAGPVNTLELARPTNMPGSERQKLSALLELYPVLLKDPRVTDIDRDTRDPYRLNFPGASPDMEFLRIDETKDKPQLQGWEEFFMGGSKAGAENKTGVIRGFYNFYPVAATKTLATTVATFADPRASIKDPSKGENREQPYLVTMPIKSGRVVWLGSGEMWRLREVSEAYYERFWTKLARYAGSGNLQGLNQRLKLSLGQTFPARSNVLLEASILGRDMKPLPESAKPEVQLVPPTGVDVKSLDKQGRYLMTAKKGNEGWFMVRFPVDQPGEYKVKIKVNETGDTEEGKFIVKETDIEMDNARPDFQLIHDLASDADEVLNQLNNEEVKKNLRARLGSMKAGDAPPTKDTEKLRLIFDLQSAEMIPSCLLPRFNTQKINGGIDYLWDQGFVVPGTADMTPPVKVPYVMLPIVLMLSLEWLIRKLLKLA
jgi:hypothetical protein